MLRILFAIYGDHHNPNAQSLNAREIALRLDPARFTSTFFYQNRPDPRLLNQPHIHLIPLPQRLATLRVAHALIWGRYDLIFYLQPTRAATLYHWFHPYGYPKKVIATVEATPAQIAAIDTPRRDRVLLGLRRAHARFAITDFVADGMRNSYAMDMPVIPVGVNLQLFTPADRSHHTPPYKVLYVGSIQPRKQVHLLADLAATLPQVEFHVIGGPIGGDTYLNQLLAQKPPNMIFHGTLLQAAIHQKMADSDIFILPSRLEGLPKVTLEAAATGLPCLVFDDYHTPSVIHGLTGFQVRTLNDMHEKLALLLNNHDLRLQMGRAALHLARQFDWNIIARLWEQALLQMF